MLPSIHVSIPALTVGCMIACAPSNTAGIKPQLGCARCCSITGIVFAVLEVIGCVIVGIVFLTTLHDTCLTVNQFYGCSRRSLKVVPADASFPTLAMSTPSFVPPWVVAEISFGISSFGHLPPLYRRDEDGTLAKLPFDGSPAGEVELNPLVGKRAAPFEVAVNADKNAQRKLQSSCSYLCPSSYLSDGVCDTQCNIYACNYDGGDCGSNTNCAYSCPSGYLSDGICDAACNVAACNYDGGDCSSNTYSHCSTIDDVCGYYTTVGYLIATYPTLLSICLIFAFSFVLRHAGAIDALAPGASGTGLSV